MFLYRLLIALSGVTLLGLVHGTFIEQGDPAEEPVERYRYRFEQSIRILAGVPRGLQCFRGPDNGSYTNFKWIDPEGLEITSNQDAPIHVEKVQKGLILWLVTPTADESGRYVCRALYQQNWTMENFLTLTIVERLSSHDCPPTQELIAGEEGTIVCGGSHDRVIVASDQYNQTLSDRFTLNGNKVLVRSVVHSDTGNYSLSLDRTTQGDRYFVMVRVRDPPTTTESQKRTERIEGFEVPSVVYAHDRTFMAISLAVVVLFVVVIILMHAARFCRSAKSRLHAIRKVGMYDVFQAANGGRETSERDVVPKSISELREEICQNGTRSVVGAVPEGRNS